LAPPSVGRSRSLFNRSEKLAHGVSYPLSYRWGVASKGYLP
jgi:hypothetical protein